MKILGALATGLLLLLLPALAAAQDFPNKPIRLIVPFPAGGPNDIIARVIGQRMSELTRQPVLIDNRGGQAGVLGTDAVAKANPDGYTIGIVSASALAISPTMEKVAYDVSKDFAPVTLVVTVPEMLVVASNVPAKNMAELVALAKAQPGKFNFASAGVGGLPHLAGETTAEVGMPDLLIENWYGMVAPAKTPEAIVAALNRIANEAMADPSVKQKLADQGLTLAGDSPEHFRGFIDAETKKWAKVIKDAGVGTTK